MTRKILLKYITGVIILILPERVYLLFFISMVSMHDYHKPSDTPDKINYDLMVKRARLVFYTAWEMANRNEMLKRDLPAVQVKYTVNGFDIRKSRKTD